MKEKVLVGLASLMLLASCGESKKLEAIFVQDEISVTVKETTILEVNTKPNISGLKMKVLGNYDYQSYFTVKYVSETKGNYKFSVDGLRPTDESQDVYYIHFAANHVESNQCRVNVTGN